MIGVDGYRGGWVAARVTGSAASATVMWATCSVGAISELLDPACVVGIDMPIGLADSGWRACDQHAKQVLGRAGSRVFLTPPRAVLELGMGAPNAVVQERSRALTGQGTSRQAMALAERILVLDSALTRHRGRDVIEVHPELSFAQLAGTVLAPKTTAAGVGQRIAALGAWLPGVVVALAHAPADVPVDDALDALACAWTAQRWEAGTAVTVPEDRDTGPFIAT